MKVGAIFPSGLMTLIRRRAHLVKPLSELAGPQAIGLRVTPQFRQDEAVV